MNARGQSDRNGYALTGRGAHIDLFEPGCGHMYAYARIHVYAYLGGQLGDVGRLRPLSGTGRRDSTRSV